MSLCIPKCCLSVEVMESLKTGVFSSFLVVGKKGCGSDLQQHLTEADWHSVPNSGVCLHKRCHSVSVDQRVRDRGREGEKGQKPIIIGLATHTTMFLKNFAIIVRPQ